VARDGSLTVSRRPFEERQPRAAYDLGLSVSIFIFASLAAGRIYRWPFDDEVFTLRIIARYPLVELTRRLLNAIDVHPPLSYVLFALGRYAGMGASQLRWMSISFTAGALAIWHWLSLESIYAKAQLSAATRILISMLFGLTPMAVSQGDALRWYPLLALLSSVTFLTYLLAGSRWYLCGISLGLAADAETLAVLVLLPIAVERYCFRRKIDWREDGAFAVLTGTFALPSIITFINIARYHPISPQTTPGLLRRVFDTALGLFGGLTLGVSQVWLAVIGAIAIFYFAYQAIAFSRENELAQRILRLALVLAIEAGILALAGLSEPRVFLFATPMMTSVMAIGFVAATLSSPELSAFMYALPFVVSLFVIGGLRRTTTPFKRNSAIPFDEVVDFVRTNQRGYTVVLTSDATVATSVDAPDLCADFYQSWSHSWSEPRCDKNDRINTVIVIKGSPLNEQDISWRDGMSTAISGKQLIAGAHFGRDDDAALKSRLTHTQLSSAILEASLYR
jgi:hypothetical protein